MSIRPAHPWLMAAPPTIALIQLCLACSASPEPKWLAPAPPAPNVSSGKWLAPFHHDEKWLAPVQEAEKKWLAPAQDVSSGKWLAPFHHDEKWLAPSTAPSTNGPEKWLAPFPDTLIAAQTAPITSETCTADNECGYDPQSKQCGPHPSFNRQPPLKDQGIICYCQQQRCARLEIKPIPCEGDFDCGILLEPRPHPVFFKSSAQKALHRTACSEGIRFTATCERTNICTLNRIPCPKGNRP